MRSILKLFHILVLVFLLTGCQVGPTTPNPFLTSGGLVIKPGATSVTGRLISASSGEPFVDEMIALAAVHRNEKGEGAYALNSYSSPQTTTDAQGFFLFKDIPVGEYAVVTGDPMTRYLVLNDLSTGNVKIWKTEAGKVLNIGELRFDYNN